jgi:hypothetical protein
MDQNMVSSSTESLPGVDFGVEPRRVDLAPIDLNVPSCPNQYGHTSNEKSTVRFTKLPPRVPGVTKADFWDNSSQHTVSLRDIPNLNDIVPQNENTANTTIANDRRESTPRSSVNSTTSNSGVIITSVPQNPAKRTGDDHQPLPPAEGKLDMIRQSSVHSRTLDPGTVIAFGAGSTADGTGDDMMTNQASDLAGQDEDKFALAGVGLGKFPSRMRPNAIQNRFARFNSTNFPRPSKHRVPSWKADASSPEAKIDLGVKQIVKFMHIVHEGTDTFESDKAFKLFIDANKEIVRAWGGVEESLRAKPAGITLGEKVDCMHAILLNLSKEVAAGGGFVRGAVEICNLSLEFGREWEILVDRDLGAKKSSLADTPQRKDTVKQGSESDESMEYIAPTELFTPQKSSEAVDETKNKCGRLEDADEEGLSIVENVTPIVGEIFLLFDFIALCLASQQYQADLYRTGNFQR